jgi:hypothetical protein
VTHADQQCHGTVLCRFATVTAVLVLTALGAYASPESRDAQRDEFGITGDEATLTFLRRARLQIGSIATLRAVKGLQVDIVRVRASEGASPTIAVFGGRDTSRHVIAYPDRMRSDNKTVTTVINGSEYWRAFHQDVPGWNPSPDEMRQIRQRTEWGLTETSLALLLRAAGRSTVSARSAGAGRYGTLTGRVVDFTMAGGRTLHFVFDERSGVPLGYAARARVVGGTQSNADDLSVERYVAFATVAGLRLPNRSEATVAGHKASVERTVAINPTINADDFIEGSRKR